VLPLNENHLINRIEYLDSEIIPQLPGLKRSIVDIRCFDQLGRTFMVEMQMCWTSSFQYRMLFNASKAYVRQLDKGQKFYELSPVYGLSLVNEDFMTEGKHKALWYHHYKMVHLEDSSQRIEGLELVFIELPKFKAQDFKDKRLQVLWLKFLTEIDENTKEVSDDLWEQAEIAEALECVQESAFTKEELAYYEKYWDMVSVEKTAIGEAVEKERKRQEALRKEVEVKAEQAQEKANQAQEKANQAEAKAEQAENKAETLLKLTVDTLHGSGMTGTEIAQKLNMTEDKINQLLNP